MGKVWSVLRSNKGSATTVDGHPIVDAPLDRLKLIMPHSAASNALSFLEERGYISKQKMGPMTPGQIVILRDVELLGEDVLAPHADRLRKQGRRMTREQQALREYQLDEEPRSDIPSVQWRGNPIRIYDLETEEGAAELRNVLGDKLYEKFDRRQKGKEDGEAVGNSSKTPADALDISALVTSVSSPPSLPIASNEALGVAGSINNDPYEVVSVPSQLPGVAIFVDYDNTAIPLISAGSSFPAEELLSFARKEGNIITAYAFLPGHATSEVQERLRRDGYFVTVCPALKLGAGDSVDKTMEQYILLLVKNYDISTFVIVSNDADFDDARRTVQNYGKKCITVFFDEEKGELRSRDGEIIPLRIKPRVVSGTNKGNIFASIISGLCENTIQFNVGDARHLLIREILNLLRIMDDELRNPSSKKSFRDLRDSLWADLRPRFIHELGKNDVGDLLDALKGYGILVTMRSSSAYTTRAFTYLVYDKESVRAQALFRIME